MLTDELRGAMQAATDQQPFEPDVSHVPLRVRQLRRRRTATWITVGATGIGAVAAVGVLATTGPGARVSPSPLDKGRDAIIQEVDNWGPTRGDLAGDAAFLDRVRQAWQNPPLGYYMDPRQGGESILTKADGTKIVTPADHSRHLTGEMKVLYAGQTPDGPAAVVAQPSTQQRFGMEIGYLLPTTNSDLELVADFNAENYAQPEFDDPGFNADVIDFKTSFAGNRLIILPADPTDSISVSLGHTLDSSGHVQRSWSNVPTNDGVAMVTATGPLGFWDTLIRVSHKGSIITETQVTDVLRLGRDSDSDRLPPAPANAVDWPLSDQEIGGSGAGGGYRTNLNDPWITQYANADEPYVDQWMVTGSPATDPDHAMIVVSQMWFYGDKAHTVVLRMLDKSAELLSDSVTDPTDRPLVFLRLPNSLGWLVVGGPDTTITGWRTGATKWSKIDTTTGATIDGKPVHTSKSSFINSPADHIQVRLDVNGKTQIVSK